MTTYLQRRAVEIAADDKAYERWYASLSYLEKQNFESKMKSIMTPEEWKANPPKIKIRTDRELKLDNDMLQMVCLNKISVEQYVRYRRPKNDNHLKVIHKEINDRLTDIYGESTR